MEKLISKLRSYKKAAVAFSGGVDSAFLLKAASDTLGIENVIAVTVMSNVITDEEKEDAKKVAEQLNVKHIIVDFNVFDIAGFKENPVDRCYICKTQIFKEILRLAEENGISTVIDGTNADDVGDYRPGMKALLELGVCSPLKECGITKAEIRAFSKDMDLFTWNRPSLACLASRIPYNEEITESKLRMVERAERYLRDKGFSQLRVRCHEAIARIELLPSEICRMYQNDMMQQTGRYMKSIGFSYVTLDLEGYRTGSLNETIKK